MLSCNFCSINSEFWLHYRVTPATPTDNGELMKLHQEDSEDAMATTPCGAMNTLRKKNWDVIVEDLSSDSSDGLESPEGCVCMCACVHV